ncbi:hypothetical protein OUZ56_016340 [Daphnia magna]|uniref:Uncharacterized protein n=1 Tax=Daphnia magna TaxID=35525 RepID=A0ABR0AQC4_9CRUS|nr:hypothetical protein OUZ56_016340 [Daphnia magna]
MAAAESVRICCRFRYSKLKYCFLLEPWQWPKLRRPTFSVRHFLSDAGECRPVLSVAMICPAFSKVPQIELVLAHSCRISIVVFALMQALMLNGLMVKSECCARDIFYYIRDWSIPKETSIVRRFGVQDSSNFHVVTIADGCVDMLFHVSLGCKV